MSQDALVARAFLSRIAEPGCVAVWALVRKLGPIDAVAAIRAGDVADDVRTATSARLATIEPEADLEVAERYGIRLVAPEHPDWPHFALGSLERAALTRLTEHGSNRKKTDEGGAPIPPLALWLKGNAELAPLGTRSASIVGSRASTDYGNLVARELAYALAARDVPVVSGGAYGIDAAAHRGALVADGVTVVVSAGGLDRPYPTGNAQLFDRAAERGLVISESPPGAAPHRQRFLTRNRLIAAFGTGTVVVEAANRSGARNTVRHCRTLGRPVMAVPGPVTSVMSAGCHELIRFEPSPATLVTSAEDVLAVIGSPGMPVAVVAEVAPDAPVDKRRVALDALDSLTRRVFDGVRYRRAAQVDEIAARSGVAVADVIRSLPLLELHGLVTARPDGYLVSPLPTTRAD